MFKQKWLTTYTGTESNQEIYNWMVQNCSDLFDSITIDEDLSRVRCFIGDTEILGISNGSESKTAALYWKGTESISDSTSTSNNGKIRGLYRVTHGVFFQFLPNSIDNKKYVPGYGVFKTSNDFIGIFSSNSGTYSKGSNIIGIEMNTGMSSSYHMIHSHNNGDGISKSHSKPTYYCNPSEKIVLTPMVCTNAEATPTEIGYWLESAMNRDVGVMTVGGHEYFSNGIFCIRND